MRWTPRSNQKLTSRTDNHIADTDLQFVAANARAVLKSTPVAYLRGAELHGTLFGTQQAAGEGVVTSVNTNYWIDHTEPLAVIKAFAQSARGWPLGNLPEGHEFLVIVPRPFAEIPSEI